MTYDLLYLPVLYLFSLFMLTILSHFPLVMDMKKWPFSPQTDFRSGVAWSAVCRFLCASILFFFASLKLEQTCHSFFFVYFILSMTKPLEKAGFFGANVERCNSKKF